MTQRHRLRLTSEILCLVVLCLATPASAQTAEPPQVVVLVVPGAGPTTAEALNRVVGELMGAGFLVTQRRLTNVTSPQHELESRSLVPSAMAAFAVLDEGDNPSIWLADRRTGRLLVQRASLTEVEASRRAAALAFAVVDILRTGIGPQWPAEPTISAEAKATSVPADASAKAVTNVAKSVGPIGEATPAAQSKGAVVFDVGPSFKRFRDVGLWGVASQFIVPVSTRLRSAINIGLESGRAEQALLTTTFLAGSIGTALWLHMGKGGWSAFDIGPGFRVGVARLVGDVSQPDRYEARSGQGFWAGPLVNARLSGELKHMTAAIGAELGWAAQSLRGTTPERESAQMSGLWLGIALTVGTKL